MKILFNTIYHLKLSQIIWQIINRVRSKSVINKKEADYSLVELFIQNVALKTKVLISGNIFTFLNISHSFDKSIIDWNFMEYGKLWNYNLEYFDYLNQDDLKIERKIEIVNDFYNFSINNRRALEPYPVSLRSINIIKFAVREKLYKESFLGYTYQELKFLHSNYEYHILGNHLLENCFAMILGGAFFKEEKWFDKAKKTLIKELDEQILSDGAHFELSPMYHQIILYRLLELIDWYSYYNIKDELFLKFLENKAAMMISWLEEITFDTGIIPLFNDAANGIAYSTSDLFAYADLLKIKKLSIPLSDCGYRSYKGVSYEIKVDYAQVGASYQPGHSHADALSFVLEYKDQPLFIEAGTSTYQIGEKRSYERSTMAHNTVVVNNSNQSEVWGGFRLGRRARTYIEYEDKTSIRGYHDGYKKIVGKVHREFIISDNQILIVDSLEKNVGNCKSYFHIAENINILKQDDNIVVLSNGVSVFFENSSCFTIKKTKYAEDYNIYKEGLTIIVDFISFLKTKIILP